MSVSLEKIPGVDSVNVSLNDGKATIRLKAGNTVTMEQVHQAVQRNGFNPQDATVTARAEPTLTGGKLQLKILGTNVTYDVAGPHDHAVQDGLRSLAGKPVIVKAVIPAPKDKTRVLQVKTFKPVK